jgi:hypothetical protein
VVLRREPGSTADAVNDAVGACVVPQAMVRLQNEVRSATSYDLT